VAAYLVETTRYRRHDPLAARHRHKTRDRYINAMFVPVALISVMTVSLAVIVVLVAREVAKR
jgi:hypothetical protein